MTEPIAAKAGRFAPKGRLRFLWPVVALGAILLWGFLGCTVYVRPNQLGIKQVLVGSGQGIQSTVYGPGLHRLTPGTERMHTFPADLQSLQFNENPRELTEHEGQRVVPAIKIQTSEGYTVSVDITVLYRVEDPYKVMTQIGPGRLYEDSAVVPRSEQVLRRTLGELDAEEFYRGDKREKATLEAQRRLSEELGAKGIKVTHVLVRQYRYDGRYQQAIEQRKIQDQTVFKNQAEAAAASVEATKNRIIAEGAANVQIELARGETEVQKIRSEAELYKRTKAAEGELAVKLARAEGTELENKALRGAGSENMVGLRMADALKGTSVIFIPTDGESGMNPLDLNSALRRFDVRGQ